MKRSLGLSVAAAIFLATGAAWGAVLRVDTNGTGNGSSWAVAASLSNALTIASSNDSLWIAQGVYSNDWGSSISFRVSSNNLTLYGGFTNGMESLNDRNWSNYPTLLDGAGARRVVHVTGTGVTLDGLVITNGNAGSYNPGSGVYRSGGSGALTLANCRIVQCRSGYDGGGGGGAYFANCTVILTNSVVATNYSAAYYEFGVGIRTLNVNLTLVDCLFDSNFSPDNRDPKSGGALYMDGGTLDARGCTFAGNRAGDRPGEGGGAVFLVGTNVAIFKNCLFRNNSAFGSGIGLGGALGVGINSGYTTAVENCTFGGNYAGLYGGAIYVGSGVLNVKNSILWSNDAATAGAGDEIYVAGGSASLRYGCLTGTGLDDLSPTVSLSNYVTNNPQFADTTNFHLCSTAGRWDPGAGTWATDVVLSPCIDAGDPASAYANEPADNGGRINLGAWGNTARASKSPTAAAPGVENRAPLVSYNVAVLKGELTNGTQADATFYYGPEDKGPGGAWPYSVAVWPGVRTGGVFSAVVVDLAPGTLYYYTSYATNAAGGSWATPSTNFTTGAAAPGGGLAIIHVDKDAIGPETGTNWMCAYRTLGRGIGAISGTTNELWVADGTYREGATLAIGVNASIYGGFTGTESSRDARSTANAVLVDGAGAYRVIRNTGGSLVLDTLVITNGVPNDGVTYEGGGISRAVAGSLTLANCRVTGCKAIQGYGGAGAYFGACSVLLTNTVFAGNLHAGWYVYGIGFKAVGANLTIADCVFSDNTAPSYQPESGGAFYVSGGTLDAFRSSFTGNQGADRTGNAGGAVYLTGTNRATLKNCLFRNNMALSKNGGALGVSLTAGYTTTVENCTFAANTAGAYGGAISVGAGALLLRNSIAWSNSATGGAGRDLYLTGAGSTGQVAYAAFTGTNSPYCDTASSATLLWGDGIITNNPQFASATDLHLRSKYGRWTVGGWINDTVSSPCIDAGDPSSAWANEPLPNGRQINMGAYGNTTQASKSRGTPGTMIIVK